ncbi:hypothetical protein AMS68_007705 [Peltaster fructicola]|uniref:DUF2293 domain-containing protein n=1 Tax=Peltaster fructicola TaxID=286661 RepID=A0A6H0Y5S3_9PEZI|nr:hypothetical protein AMS68_007705 [Peltaster fructicola]
MTSGHGSTATGSKFAQSNLRDITKRREKPYKTEQATVLGKKKKLETRVSYTAAPPGYVFLPLGTPDLAECCKEISRQQGYPVNIVNAKPANKTVMDPGKISHHIQRIGYHFRNEAVEQACTQLRYVIYNGRFISEQELQQRSSQSFIAQLMARHNLHPTAEVTKESPEKVSAAIKELFPRIPDKDLHEIVHHAWADGSDRVGTAADIDLSRRVQLAVIARIRHNYTDYDRLLKAFGWQYARREIESDCLKKLIEWRGEQEDGEDDGLEEIVLKTIVLDDDDAPRLRHSALRRDLTPGTGPGDASDTSIEIVHRPAIADDLRAEDPSEQHHGYLYSRGQARINAERSNVARAKLDAVRGQMRAQEARPPALPPSEIVTRINIDDRNGPPQEIIVNGVVMKRASSQSVPMQQQQQQHPVPLPLPPAPYAYSQPIHGRQDIPMPSIETAKLAYPPTASDYRSSSILAPSPRHGQPALLQYIHAQPTQSQPPQQRRFAGEGLPLPPKPGQPWQPRFPFTTVSNPPMSVPPSSMPPFTWAGAPLPPIPSAQPTGLFMPKIIHTL